MVKDLRGDSEFAEAEGEDALAKLQREWALLARAAVEDVPAAKLGDVTRPSSFNGLPCFLITSTPPETAKGTKRERERERVRGRERER